MGFRLSSFIAGAAENITDTLKEDERQAAISATYGVKALKENYDKVQAENRKLETQVSENIKTLRTFDNTATEAELFAAATNKTYMEMAVEAAKTNPGSFKVADVVKIKEDNPSSLTAMERLKKYTEIPAVSQAARQAEGTTTTTEGGLFGLGALRSRASARAGSKAEEQTAKAMGVSIDQLRAASGYVRPEIETGAQFDFTSMQAQPSSMAEIVKKLEVQRYQAGQKFGEDSDQYTQINNQLEQAQSQVKKADTKIEDRRDRLELLRRDSKDPAVVAAATKEINGINADIQARREATSTKREREGTGEDKIKYTNAKTRMEDYMNTDMTTNKGLGWRKYVEEKVVFDTATKTNITIPGKKVGLTPAQEKEYIEGMTAARMQGLKDLGLVTEKGHPVNNEVKALMTAYGLNRPASAPTPTATPTTTPSAAQPATPTQSKVPQLTREDQEALVWANTPANAGPKADAIKKKIQNKINGAK